SDVVDARRTTAGPHRDRERAGVRRARPRRRVACVVHGGEALTRAIRVLVVGVVAVHTAGAQSVIATADSLLQRGILDRAESLYYDAARLRPRDPAVRSGLARYLAGRGKSRVAVTLFEEAMRFGGDSTSIGADLAPLYLGLWEYRSLLGLRP